VDNIIGIVLSWQFLLMGLIVGLFMAFFMKIGSLMWKSKPLRKVVKFFTGISVWLPPALGAGLGAIPYWPRPGPVQEMPEWQGYTAMIVLGLLAGVFYERIWKFVQERLKGRGIDIELDMSPKDQLKGKER